MKPKRFISALLTAAITFTALPGCIMAEEINAPVDETFSIVGPNEIQEFETISEFYSYLDNLPSKDMGEVLDNPHEQTDLEVAKAAYDNLKDKGIDLSDEQIQKEFDNVLAYSLYPMGLTDMEYRYAVGTLVDTLDQMQNPFACYYPLAMSSHLITCGEDHDVNEYDKIVCINIMDTCKGLSSVTTEDMLDSIFLEDGAYMRIKTAINNGGAALGTYLVELEHLVELSKTPTDIHDDQLWFELFGNLDATLGAEESLFETYIALGIKIHNLNFPEAQVELPDYLELTRD